MWRAGSLLRPRTSLCVPSASAGAIRWPSTTNPEASRAHREPQDIPIKRKQVVQFLAPDRCTTQSCDHRFDPLRLRLPLDDMHYAERTRLDPSFNGVDSALWCLERLEERALRRPCRFDSLVTKRPIGLF